MPFTPFHMGPGLAIKAMLHGGFSLLIFGWAQILMDLQPLVAMLAGEGRLHGFSHSYAGATLLALVAAGSGKVLAQWGLQVVQLTAVPAASITWRVALLSGAIGTFSHVALDSVMHRDITPLAPFSPNNSLLGVVTLETLHRFCLYTGLVGGVVVLATCWWTGRNRS